MKNWVGWGGRNIRPNNEMGGVYFHLPLLFIAIG